MSFYKSIAVACCMTATILSSQSFGEDNAEVAASEPSLVENNDSVQITEEGNLVGKVFATVDGEQKPLDAKVTLSSDGVVINSVQAAEDGSFSFDGVDPGSYQLLGSTDGYVGGQAFDVQPYTADYGGCSSCNLSLQSADQAVYDSPVCGAPASTCGSCGGGGGIGGGGIGGGGLLNGRRLLALGAVGGIIAVAVSDDDDDVVVTPEN